MRGQHVDCLLCSIQCLTSKALMNCRSNHCQDVHNMPQILKWSELTRSEGSVLCKSFGLMCRRRWHLASFLAAARSSAQWQPAPWGLAKERGN